ncbi:hypothetical protein ACH5RR_015536 [Cinchona calisaya]|uniref:Uncharacterized protein n=1 Tax=Cinchona calisaya TaxID=153742 RepID=A0ABD2ZTF3_9GENT
MVKTNGTCDVRDLGRGGDPVGNHLLTVRTIWSTIVAIRARSGFGWNESIYMITASPNAHHDYVQKNPTHDKYINKEIDMNNEMALVVGKDLATGSFAKGFTDVRLETLITLDDTMENTEEVSMEKDIPSSAASTSSTKQHRQGGILICTTWLWKLCYIGFDELMPLSHRGIDGLGGLGATVVDALDTGMTMGVDKAILDADGMSSIAEVSPFAAGIHYLSYLTGDSDSSLESIKDLKHLKTQLKAERMAPIYISGAGFV